MKPYPRLRRAALASGAALTVLLATAWMASARWYVNVWGCGPSVWGIDGGCFFLVQYEDGPPFRPDAEFGRRAAPFRLNFDYARRPNEFRLAVPLWLPAALAGLATRVAWRRRAGPERRATPPAAGSLSNPEPGHDGPEEGASR